VALKKSQRSLRAWTKQKWRTKSGKKSSETGERYLPEKAIKALSDEEYAATSRKKRADTKKGKQFSKQPKKTARKVRKYRRVGKQEGGEIDSRYEGAKKLLKDAHDYAVKNNAAGKDSEGKPITFYSSVIGKSDTEHYIVNRYNPKTKTIETDEQIFKRINPLIKSGQLKPYKTVPMAELQRKRMRNEILNDNT